MSHHHKVTFAPLPPQSSADASSSSRSSPKKATIITIIAVVVAVSIMSMSTGYLGGAGPVGVGVGSVSNFDQNEHRNKRGVGAVESGDFSGGVPTLLVNAKAAANEAVYNAAVTRIDEEAKEKGDAFSSNKEKEGTRGGALEVDSQGGGGGGGGSQQSFSRGTKPPPQECLTSPALHFPLSPIEHELKRLAALTSDVMEAINATYWPADATLLGLMRSGRVATDRDLDFSIHATFDTCWKVLASIREEFVKRGAKVKYFKVATAKTLLPEGVRFGGNVIDSVAARSKKVKIGRYAMVRVVREFGDFDTGPDFNCVYTDDPRGSSFFTHKGVLTVLPPKAVYPLGTCLMYNKTIPCPRDGVAFLGTLTPRYDGCLVYPHCMGKDPSKSHRDCLTPHPHRDDLSIFVESTKIVKSCGFVSMVDHYENSPQCKKTFTPTCDDKRGLCFIQPFTE